MSAKYLNGARFGRLLVFGRAENDKDGSAMWICVCDCGQKRIVAGTGLRAGRNKSCGCASPRFTSERVKTHGLSGTRTYRIWNGMHARCSDAAKGKTRKNYFEKGIRVCDRWKSFQLFFLDMGEAPIGYSIERRNGSRGYSKANCTWATNREQANNTSRNSIVHHDGKSMTVSMWATQIGIKQNTLLYRLRRGMPVQRALQKNLFVEPKNDQSRENSYAAIG